MIRAYSDLQGDDQVALGWIVGVLFALVILWCAALTWRDHRRSTRAANARTANPSRKDTTS